MQSNSLSVAGQCEGASAAEYEAALRKIYTVSTVQVSTFLGLPHTER